MNAIIGQPISRVDGPAKVTGQAVYAAEFRLHNLAYAALVSSMHYRVVVSVASMRPKPSSRPACLRSSHMKMPSGCPIGSWRNGRRSIRNRAIS